eukprot:gene1838-980_t
MDLIDELKQKKGEPKVVNDLLAKLVGIVDQDEEEANEIIESGGLKEIFPFLKFGIGVIEYRCLIVLLNFGKYDGAGPVIASENGIQQIIECIERNKNDAQIGAPILELGIGMWRNYGRMESIQKAFLKAEFVPYLLEKFEEKMNEPKLVASFASVIAISSSDEDVQEEFGSCQGIKPLVVAMEQYKENPNVLIPVIQALQKCN